MQDLLTKFEEVRLAYRNRTRSVDRPKVKCAEDTYNVFSAMLG